VLQLTITDLAEKNKCFAKTSDGLSVFVQGLLAIGDRVEAQVFKVKKNYLEARAQRILEFSNDRVEPVCPYFGICGGCKWQHISYQSQLNLKAKQVQDALVHLGGFKHIEVEPPKPARSEYGYRNKIEFSFSAHRYLLPDEMAQTELEKPKTFALGFHAPGRYDKVIDVDTCYIAHPDMVEVLNLTRKFALEHNLSAYSTKENTGFLRNLVIRRGERTGELMVNLVTSAYEPDLMEKYLAHLQSGLGHKLTTLINNITTRSNTVAFGETEHVIYGPGRISDCLNDYRFMISANSFFQTNTAQAKTLYDTIIELARFNPQDVVYDLYCGTGSISQYISEKCLKVFGVELIESAVEDARHNAEMNRIENCEFKHLDLKSFKDILPELQGFGLPDVVITDPPRAGMHPKAVKTLLQLNPETIIYVSCNPASLARDGFLFCEENQYKLTEVIPVDMFPHTNHIESVARFERVAQQPVI
jgi:23S rRNA (uracil1939-C5)-methyltransferase